MHLKLCPVKIPKKRISTEKTVFYLLSRFLFLQVRFGVQYVHETLDYIPDVSQGTYKKSYRAILLASIEILFGFPEPEAIALHSSTLSVYFL